ncbi:MAG: UbiD family decarboxylase [Chloroflexi bacterium]|nr:UbiD family decarboxylase [Chloroflexota bacterium]
MPYKDLREFMAALEKKGLLGRVKAEVDPSWEINGVTKKLMDDGGVAVLFEKVKGHKVPVLCGLVETLERFALALEMPSDDRKMMEEWLRRTEHPIPPRLVKTGPCKENIMVGDKADIDAIFPPVLWHKADGAPFVGTLGIQVTKDPETGVQNCGLYRMMYRTKKETGLLLCYGQHGEQHLQKWARMYPGKPMPVAVAIGTDPVYLIAAASKFSHPPGEEEYAGALRGQPLEVVKCETCDLKVPASAEIVLEGEVYPGELEPDGPFGEYPGYQTGQRLANLFHLRAVTHRDNPIFLGKRCGWSPEGNLLWGKSMECLAYTKLRKIPGVMDVHLVHAACSFKLLVSIRKSWPGHVNQVIHAVWGDDELAHLLKNVVVVDENVDIRNNAQVEWAVAVHVQPDRDILIARNCPEIGLDPSQPYSKQGLTAKWGIDATMPVEAYRAEGTEPPLLCDDPDIKAKVEAQWQKYGLNEKTR